MSQENTKKEFDDILEAFDKRFSITSDSNTKNEKKWVSYGWLSSVGVRHRDDSKKVHSIGSLIPSDEIKKYFLSSLTKVYDLGKEEAWKSDGAKQYIEEIHQVAIKETMEKIETLARSNLRGGYDNSALRVLIEQMKSNLEKV